MTFYVMIFIFGLAIGSFLNAVVYRLHSGESVFRGRSHCPKCGHTLAWYELVPVISFIIQRGKCRACKRAISWQYPAVEIATAALFLLIFNFKFLIFNEFSNFEFLNTLYYFIIASLLIVIFVFDLKHYVIPDKIVYLAIAVVFLYKPFIFLNFAHWDLYIPLFVAFLVSAIFAVIFFVSRGRWLGFGDVKLAFFMGLFLGWPAILPAIFLAFLLGGATGIVLIFLHKKTMKSQIPFGPFLVAGTFASMFFGAEIINWYKGFFL